MNDRLSELGSPMQGEFKDLHPDLDRYEFLVDLNATARKIAEKLTNEPIAFSECSVNELFDETVLLLNRCLDIRMRKRNLEFNIYNQSFFLVKSPRVGLIYKYRIEELTNLFETEFTSSFLRIKALRLGMRSLFQYDDDLPPVNSEKYLNELILWLRRAVEFYKQITDNEIIYTKTVSLRQLLGIENLGIELRDEGGLKYIDYQLADMDLHFCEFEHIRILGIALAIPSSENQGRFQLELRRIGGAQPGRSLVYGNVGRRENGVAIARSSARNMRNIDPRGWWRIYFQPNSSAGIPVSSIKDVELELDLAISLG